MSSAESSALVIDMAKTYIDIIKYMVEAKFEINGFVEKPDIIGAVFGQTEGLLGSSLDLRELQKNGKIGRIEIDTNTSGSKTYGKLHLPSSLARVETCILAAAIESVDRVGPFETFFKVERIEDTRNEKRKKIINRAKDLVRTLLTTELPDSKEISDLVETDVKSSTVSTYGQDNLPAGPDLSKSDEVIIVEGRADVITLLKNDVTNCIAIGGASGVVPKTVIELCALKESTVFVDGDRGGNMILKGLLKEADVDFIAKAPDGKEVEELTRKEIIKSLRNRIPLEQFLQHNSGFKDVTENNKNGSKPREDRPSENRNDTQSYENRNDFRQQNRQRDERQIENRGRQSNIENQDSKPLSPSRITNNLERKARERPERMYNDNNRPTQRGNDDFGIRGIDEEKKPIEIEDIPLMDEQKKPYVPNDIYMKSLDELNHTLRGRLYKKDSVVIKEVPIRELIQSIQDTPDVYAIVFDGIITQRLVEIAYKNGVKEIYAIRSSQISRVFPDLNTYTKESA